MVNMGKEKNEIHKEFKDLIKCQYHELLPVTDLIKVQNPRNRNKHPKEQIKRLAKIMRDNGIRHPIVISRLSGHMTKGHGRLEAAIENKWDSYPVQYQEYESEDLEYADMTADNAIASWAELDFGEINKDLEHLGPFDIELLGLKDFELEPADKYADKDADDVPQVKETDIKLGDLFQLGAHRLLCGDATDSNSVSLLMNGEKADMVLTDPPYGIGFEYNEHKDLKGDPYKEFCSKWFDNLRAFSEFIVIFTGWSYNGFWYSKEPKDTFYWICKNKRSGGSISYFRKVEPIFIWGEPENKYNFDFFEVNTSIDPDLHKVHTCPKQIQLIEEVISGCKAHGSVLDVFCGSGSTLIACEKTNRKCFGMEIDPHYCQVIIDRFEKFSGIKAIKL